MGVLDQGRQSALDEAISIAGANPGATRPIILTGTNDNSGGDIRFGRWDPERRSFDPALLAPDAAEVTIRLSDDNPNGSVPLFFGGLFGISHRNVGTRAIAHRAPRLPVPIAAWITNDLRPRAVFVEEESLLEVNGAIAIRSTAARALTIQTGGTLRATMLNMLGGIAVDSDDSVHCMLEEESQIPFVPPLPIIDLESLPQRPEIIDAPGDQRLEPGYYPTGLVATLGRYELEDGVFLFGSPGIELTGLARLTSRNAIILLAENTRIRVEDASIKLHTTREINGIENSSRVALAAIAGTSPSLLFEDARILLDGMLHAPGSPLQAIESEITSTRLAVDSITLKRDSTLKIGEAEPHPVDLLLVR